MYYIAKCIYKADLNLTCGGTTYQSEIYTDNLGRITSDNIVLGSGNLQRRFTYAAGSKTAEHVAHGKCRTDATTSITERLEIAYEKFYRKQKMIYEEFVMMLMTNDELCFYYNGNVYQIDHSLCSATYVCIIEYNGDQRLPQKNEKFSSSLICLIDLELMEKG